MVYMLCHLVVLIHLVADIVHKMIMFPNIRVLYVLYRLGLFVCWPVPTWSGMNQAVARKLSTLSLWQTRYALINISCNVHKLTQNTLLQTLFNHWLQSDPHIVQSLANTPCNDPQLAWLLVSMVRTGSHLLGLLANTICSDPYHMQSLANTVHTDPYLMQSPANTVRTDPYLTQSPVETVCIDP